MRQGENPGKADRFVDSVGFIRVIMPVYGPSISGYFAQLLPILDLSLDSLRKSGGPDIRVTIVANGCCTTVENHLVKHLNSGAIDELVVHKRNLGKVDAVLSGARSTFEDILVLTDCDVMFRSGWVEATVRTFETYPECGFLGLAPLPNLRGMATSTTVLEASVRRELSLDYVIDPEDFRRFAMSIGRPVLADQHSGPQLVVRRARQVACVGAGHFAYVTRRAVLASVPIEAAHGIPTAEMEWLDLPPDNSGYWRLSTPEAFALHMGNRIEDWMHAEAAAIAPPSRVNQFEHVLRPPRQSPLRFLPYRVRSGVARQALHRYSS